MLLDGAVRAQLPADLGIDLVPRPADLPLEIAAQRLEILIARLVFAGENVRPPHALMARQLLERDGAALAMPSAAQARSLHDDARHVLTHGSAPYMNEAAQTPIP